MLSGAAEVRAQLATLSTAITHVTDTVRRTAKAKVEGVAKLHTRTVAGRSAADIAFLVAVAPAIRADKATDDDLSSRRPGWSMPRHTNPLSCPWPSTAG